MAASKSRSSKSTQPANFPVLHASLSSGASSSPIAADVVFVFQATGSKPAALASSPYASTLERLKAAEGFSARVGSTQMVRFGGIGQAENLVFVGLGQPSDLTEDKVRQAGAALWARLGSEKLSSAAVHVSGLSQAGGVEMRMVRALLEGVVLSCYRFDKYKKAPDPAHATRKITLITQDRSMQGHIESEIQRVLAVGEAVNLCRDWSNEPSNVGTPEYFAAESQKLARKYGLKCRVMSEAEARREKMGLFLAVGQGSEREGKIVVLEYSPKGARKARTLAFVGKGITFDSGGISIKPSLKMEEMKHDMTGAATLMAATLLAARLKVPNRIVTILAFTENMPDGTAIQPGNVVRARNGKTVEIINTDAEGRLILADVLDYAHDFKPDAIIDAATLTGAVQIALGKQCCAILGNDDGLIESIRQAGSANHERIWQLPMFDEYFEDMKSDTADMRNSANDGSGGTIRGAIFMNQFIRKGMKWAHLDIAATANGMGHIPYFPKKGASGMYVRTLAQFAADF